MRQAQAGEPTRSNAGSVPGLIRSFGDCDGPRELDRAEYFQCEREDARTSAGCSLTVEALFERQSGALNKLVGTHGKGQIGRCALRIGQLYLPCEASKSAARKLRCRETLIDDQIGGGRFQSSCRS